MKKRRHAVMKCWRAFVPLERESGEVKVAATRLLTYSAARAEVVKRGGYIDRDETELARQRARRARDHQTLEQWREHRKSVRQAQRRQQQLALFFASPLPPPPSPYHRGRPP